jgi:hypothetical protein
MALLKNRTNLSGLSELATQKPHWSTPYTYVYVLICDQRPTSPLPGGGTGPESGLDQFPISYRQESTTSSDSGWRKPPSARRLGGQPEQTPYVEIKPISGIKPRVWKKFSWASQPFPQRRQDMCQSLGRAQAPQRQATGSIVVIVVIVVVVFQMIIVIIFRINLRPETNDGL